jgi:hypothetical protein
MKRREVIVGLSALASAPFALSFAGNATAQSLIQATSSAEKRGGVSASMIRLNLMAMQFATAASAVDIDALFDVDGKLLPYRLACFRVGSVSPQSKLLSFNFDQRALAGFRVDLCKSGRSTTVGLGGGSCSAGVEASYRLPVAGSYVLDIPSNGMGVTVSAMRAGQRLDDPAWMRARAGQSYVVFDITPAFG